MQQCSYHDSDIKEGKIMAHKQKSEQLYRQSETANWTIITKCMILWLALNTETV